MRISFSSSLNLKSIEEINGWYWCARSLTGMKRGKCATIEIIYSIALNILCTKSCLLALIWLKYSGCYCRYYLPPISFNYCHCRLFGCWLLLFFSAPMWLCRVWIFCAKYTWLTLNGMLCMHIRIAVSVMFFALYFINRTTIATKCSHSVCRLFICLFFSVDTAVAFTSTLSSPPLPPSTNKIRNN